MNPLNADSYGNFAIRVKWEGRYVAGLSTRTDIKPSTGAARKSSDQSITNKSPARMKYESITLEHGVTYDKDFEQWANGALNSGSQSGRKAPRKDILIEIHDEAGKLAVVWSVRGCWVSRFKVLHDLGNDPNAVTIETITLENEGFECKPPSDP